MTKTSDTAAQAAINTAARELHLPTVRTESERLAELAIREQQTHRGYLAEVLAAEVDDRTNAAGSVGSTRPSSHASSGWPSSTSTPSRRSSPRPWPTWPQGTISMPASPWSCSATQEPGRPIC